MRNIIGFFICLLNLFCEIHAVSSGKCSISLLIVWMLSKMRNSINTSISLISII